MLIEHLQRTFAERSRRNPNYSLRAFARALGVDSSTLSALLRGKRPLTPKMAQKLVERLDFDNAKQAQQALLSAIGVQDQDKAPDYVVFDVETAEVLGSWEHFAILAVLELSNFKAETRSIARRLNIPQAVAMDALSRMEKLGLVKAIGPVWALTGKNMATPSNIPSAALRKVHKQTIDKAISSLEKDPVDVRDISGVTMAIDKSKLSEARTLIKDFRRRLSAFLEDGKRTSVYHLNIQLFPLTQEQSK